MKKLSRLLRVATLVSGCCAFAAQAQQGLRPAGWFAQAAVAEHGTHAATAGVVWPWSWRTQVLGTELSGLTEAYVSLWRARDFGGGHRAYLQLGLVPVLRFRFDQGRSNWFAEAGIGVTVMNKVYSTPDTQFSTRFQFHDMLGVGYTFGARRDQEIGLRLVHFSNAGIDHPNPGTEFLQLRYGRSF